jgi:CSLREA domain-containing protein
MNAHMTLVREDVRGTAFAVQRREGTLPKILRAGRLLSARLARPVLLAALFALISGCGGGGVYTVNSSGDEGDSNPGDGFCRTGTTLSNCTLRAAIEEANAITGTQEIRFNLPSGEETISVHSSLPVIIDDVIIDGTTQPGYDGINPVVQISGAELDPHLVASGLNPSSADLTVKAVKILEFKLFGIATNGDLILDTVVISQIGANGINTCCDSSRTINLAHSILEENEAAGIYGMGNFILNDVTVRDNGGPGIVVESGSLTITDSLINGNTASHTLPVMGHVEGGGITFLGGGALTVTGSTIQANTGMESGAVTGGIYLENGEAQLTDSLVTENQGWTSGGMYILSGHARISGSTFTRNTGFDAGGIYVTGGYAASLLLDSGTYIGRIGAGNAAPGLSDGTRFGGGIYADGSVTVIDSTIEGNSGHGIQAEYPATSVGTVQFTNSAVQDNSLTGIKTKNANLGFVEGTIRNNAEGGISANRGEVILVKSSVSGNRNSSGEGSGIYGINLSKADIGLSTISGNSTDHEGGGLYFIGPYSGLIHIHNSTISGNRAAGRGGGLVAAGGSVNLSYVTIVHNAAGSAGGILNYATLNIADTILAENTGGNCGSTAPITSGGHNLLDSASCWTFVPTDILNEPAPLGPLQDNGGTTFTHALLAGSPALDAANPSTCPSTDQRGVSRPQGARCDIGAFESETPVTATPRIATSTSTPTETPTLAPLALTFDPVNFSTEVVYGYGRSCSPKEVTIQVKVTPSESVKSVGIFYRLEEKEGTGKGPWGGGFSMIPQGGGWYTYTLYGENLPGTFQWSGDAWVAVQFVANGKDGQPIAHSDIYRKVTLGRCYQ